MKPSRQSGFTYLEMLISLALLGLISVALASSLDFGRQVWKRAEGYSDIEQTAVLRSSLRGWMQETEDHAAIIGSEQSISFTVRPSISPHPDIFQMDVTLGIEKGQNADILFLSLVGYNIADKVIFQDRRIFQSDLQKITITYYGNASSQKPKTWHNEWSFEEGQIDLIKITANNASGRVFIPFTARIGISLAQRKISASSLVPPD